MKHPHLAVTAVAGAVLLACASTPAAAALVTVATTDAFDLAAAAAPGVTGLNAVTGAFVEVGPPPIAVAGAGAIGTFTGGASTLGFDSGVVLSTGDVAGIYSGAPTTPGFDFGWTPSVETAGLLGLIPGGGTGFFDSVRFQLAIDPGFDANFVNFDLAFGTSESGVTTDRVGIFLDGVLYGLPPTWTLDQHHPFVGLAGSGFGFDYNLYPGGDVIQYPSLRVSLPVLAPASWLTLDFVVGDVTDGMIDTALFLGNFSGSAVALGTELYVVPEPGTTGLLLAGLGGLALVMRRRRPS